MIVVLVVHILIAAFLVGIILIQKNEGGLGGLGGGGGSGGMGGLLAGRTQANLLTRTTALLAAAFFVTSVTLAVFSSHGGHDVLVPDAGAPTSTTTPVPLPGITGGTTLPGATNGTSPVVPALPEPAKPAAPAGQ
jgi:preprotein translocase subunit SecG